VPTAAPADATSTGSPARARGRPSRFTREEMLAQAAEMFADRGYEVTTLGDLAEGIGIAKATLFHHFRTKEQILFELYARAMDIALERLVAVDHANADSATALLAMVREHTLVILQNRAVFTIFFDEEGGLEPEHLAKVRDQQREYINLISHRVTDLIADGRVASDVHPRIAVQTLLGAGSWTYRWVEPSRGQTNEEIADAIARFTVYGLLARN
jgi:TetR/AcrR family transcriptional regulator, cholesterol catabolism regulator